jgi:hypothetical protein
MATKKRQFDRQQNYLEMGRETEMTETNIALLPKQFDLCW